jgi:hypothetical protein
MGKLKGNVIFWITLFGMMAITPALAGAHIPHHAPTGEEPLLYGLAALGLGWIARRLWWKTRK